MQYIQNIDLMLREVQDEVHKNKENLVEYKNEFKASLKENKIKQFLEAMEKNLNTTTSSCAKQ